MDIKTIGDQAELTDAVFHKLLDRAARKVANVVAYGDAREVAKAFAEARATLTRQGDLFMEAIGRDEAQ